jgi:hypothetical protein
MEQPDFPVPPRKYLVTGYHEVTAVLTIHPADKNGDRRWELDNGATLYDVTHLACRSARYTPAAVVVRARRQTRRRLRFQLRQGERCLQSRAARSKTMRFSS